MCVGLKRRVLGVAALVCAGFAVPGLTVSAVVAQETINIIVDEAKLAKLPERAVTLVVGNPLVADVSIQPGGIMVITGKGFGSTNVVALDRSGTVVMDRVVEVMAPERLVTVYRGVQRETYSCAPDCQRRVMMGDADTYFGQTLGQVTSRAAAAATVSEQAQPKD